MGFDEEKRFVALLVALGCGTGIVISLGGILAGIVNVIHRRKAECDLKRDMLDRGMSVEEIAQVIEATSESGSC